MPSRIKLTNYICTIEFQTKRNEKKKQNQNEKKHKQKKKIKHKAKIRCKIMLNEKK